jgi:hypothetical protein
MSTRFIIKLAAMILVWCLLIHFRLWHSARLAYFSYETAQMRKEFTAASESRMAFRNPKAFEKLCQQNRELLAEYFAEQEK